MTQSLDLVFCGTPRFAVPTLESLVAAGFRVNLVVTQPDRPKGRGLELVQSPVKQSAQKLNLPSPSPTASRPTTNSAPNSLPSNPTPSSSSATAASFPSGCSIFLH